MKLKNNLKGFGLIEIMVAMGIAAVILTLGLFGIQFLQKNGRDSQRGNAIADIGQVINNYKLQNLNYPQASIVEFRTDGFYLSNVKEFPFTGANKAASSTTAGQTKYYYSQNASGYILCTQLESGKIQSGGTLPCPATLP